jgi:hypothetical protein
MVLQDEPRHTLVINRMRDYLPYTRGLLKSPFCRPADYRVCTQCEGFMVWTIRDLSFLLQYHTTPDAPIRLC